MPKIIVAIRGGRGDQRRGGGGGGGGGVRTGKEGRESLFKIKTNTKLN